MPHVASSAIDRLHYIAGERELHVVFVSGKRYRYFDGPPGIYAQFLGAPSKGAYFNEAIRDRFEFEADD
jgi:hypothetical protein